MKKKNYITIFLFVVCSSLYAVADSIPSWYHARTLWHIGVEASPAFVPGTNDYLKGANRSEKVINSTISGAIKADFGFAENSCEGMLYRGVYQGIGIAATAFNNSLLGTPFSLYVYQGAPIVHFSHKFWLGYEWKFGAAAGWSHYEEGVDEDNRVIGTPITAHMGLGFKLHYQMNHRWALSFGADVEHYSNGNTSWPNSGVNTIGATIGVAYTLNSDNSNPMKVPAELVAEVDRARWMYDIMFFGAWRKRIVNIGNPPTETLVPGKFGVLGLQFATMRKLNRWVAVGPALDAQWDESAGLNPYWIEYTYDDYLKFRRPSFIKQLSVGVSAHAELTMPIFAVNVGLGYDMLNPDGNKRFYQSLALKTFISDMFYLNVGYRLGNFKDPQNLMLGVGMRL